MAKKKNEEGKKLLSPPIVIDEESKVLKEYCRVKINNDDNSKYIALVNQEVNEIIETDIIITKEVYNFILDNPNIKVIKELPPIIHTLNQFKSFVEVFELKEPINTKTPLQKALEGVLKENSSILIDNARKDIVIEQLQKDVSSLMLLVAQMNNPIPKIIKKENKNVDVNINKDVNIETDKDVYIKENKEV